MTSAVEGSLRRGSPEWTRVTAMLELTKRATPFVGPTMLREVSPRTTLDSSSWCSAVRGASVRVRSSFARGITALCRWARGTFARR